MHIWLVETALSNASVATALAVVALAVGRFVRRPALRHALWLLVLVKLITPPLARVPLVMPTFPEPAPPPVAVAIHEDVIEPTTLEWSPVEEAAVVAPVVVTRAMVEPPARAESGFRLDRRDVLAVGWLAGVVAWWLLGLLRLWRLMRALRRSARAPEGLADRLGILAFDLGLRRVPELRFVESLVSPFVAALGTRAIVVVPSSLWKRLDEDQRDALLLHELAHLRRGDPWVRLVELAATGLYWWLPTLWLARRALHAAEEQACDAWVVETRPGVTKAYATALIETVDFLSRARAWLGWPRCRSGRAAWGVSLMSEGGSRW